MYSEPSQRSKVEYIGKMIELLKIFVKKSILNFWEGSEYLSGFKYV